MAQFDRNAAAPFGRTVSRAEAAAVDAGLRAYMLSIYNYMVLGLAITGFAALGTYMLAVTDNPADAVVRLREGLFLTSFGQWVFISPLKWVIMLAPLGVVFLLGARVNSMSTQAAQITFWVFAGLMGLSLASIFLVYTHTSIVRVFFITAASFGALSLYGYTTQKDLSGMASFLIMGLIGILIASLVNIFLASTAMQFAISVIGVLVFAGLTAYDTQRLKTEYLYGGMDGVTQEKTAILGALSLYLNFINMFTMLLQLFGNRE
jgi:FtsH-binding integral membrane protein